MFKIISVIIGCALVFFLMQRMGGNKKQAAENIALGKEFLAANLEKEGVEVTASGLQSKVLTEGTGTEHPTGRSNVTVHYHGTLLDGTVFDSSVQRGEPITFGLNQVIPGWTEGVQLMVVGEKRRFFIPSRLAYGNRGAGSIQAGSTLIFEVELLSFK
ncbi:Peptidylprolyl isomerase FKBP-type [Moritella viscosa]|nr:FKBP-type peptidyl-prolyl cis-trans isomerase [Moritella viscosa]SGZ01413.1 Peptidylprolyl isomerase FKBP-type [Moritella viscosa]